MGRASKILKTLKANGMKQRRDVSLSTPLINALVQRVLSGQTLYPQGGLEVCIPEGENGSKCFKISRGTLNSWITRGNVVPETGEPLKAILDKARESYRINTLIEKEQELIRQAEEQLYRVVKARTKVPIRSITGEVVREADGSIAYREDPQLLRSTIKAAIYILERLDPQKWGRETKSTPDSTWSLNELRAIKDK